MRKICFVLAVLMISVITHPVISNDNVEKGTVSVNINKYIELAPDVAEITFAVKTTNPKNMQKAVDDNKVIMDNAVKTLETMINKQNGDYIKTANYNAAPVYYYKDSKQVFNGYEVTNKIIVHTKSLDILGKMIDSGINAGVNNVSNLTFSLQNYDAQCNKLIASATKDAKQRANVIAQALSESIVGVKIIDTSCSTNSSYAPRQYMSKNAMSDSIAETATNINVGNINLNVNVNASFYVK